MPLFSRSILFIFVLALVHSAVAQKKLLKQLDSNWTHTNRYINQYSPIEFEHSNLTDKLVPMQEIDQELLSAAVFFEINKEKFKRSKTYFEFNEKLDGIAYLYSKHYKKFRFRRSVDNYLRLKRSLKKVHQYLPLDFKHIEGYTCLPYSIDYTRGAFYYKEGIAVSETDLYFGKDPKGDSTALIKPIELISYKALAEKIVREFLKGKSGNFIRSKAYELLAVKTSPIKKKRYKSRIPEVKVIFLVGAYQNKFIMDLE